MHIRNPFWLRFVTMPSEGGGSDGEGTTPAEGNDPEKPNEDGDRLGEPGLRALRAEREANKAAKAKIAEYESRIKEFEDRDKTEAEKTAERTRELERSSAANARKALQYEVAAEKGIPLSLATRLRGDDKDALLKDADDLLPLLQHEPDTQRTPKADKSAGHGGGPKPTTLQQAIAGHLK